MSHDQTDARPIPLPLRRDTMLGVCAGLGEEFGFNPMVLRIAISSLVIVDLKLAIAVYLGLGIALAMGRLLAPARRTAPLNSASQSALAEANDSRSAPEKLAA